MLVGASVFALAACGDNTPSSALTDSQWSKTRLEPLRVNLLQPVLHLKNPQSMPGLWAIRLVNLKLQSPMILQDQAPA